MAYQRLPPAGVVQRVRNTESVYSIVAPSPVIGPEVVGTATVALV
jgi:hypothetical protein